MSSQRTTLRQRCGVMKRCGPGKISMTPRNGGYNRFPKAHLSDTVALFPLRKHKDAEGPFHFGTSTG